MFCNGILFIVVALTVVVSGHNNRDPTDVNGVWKDVDVNDSTVKYVANQATYFLQDKTNATGEYRLSSVLKAKRLIFPLGGVYKISLELGVTTCQPQEDAASLPTCIVVMANKCKLLVLLDGNITTVFSHRCAPYGGFGTYLPIDVKNPRVNQVAIFAVGLEGHHNIELREILTAYVQVVAGLNYAMRIEIYRGQLKAKTPAELTRCTVIVWDQPWRTPRLETTYFQCDKELF